MLEWIFALIGCLILRSLIMRYANNYSLTMSPATRKIQKVLVQVPNLPSFQCPDYFQTLTLQAIIPAVSLLSAVAFVLREYLENHPLLLTSRFLLGSLVPILDAFVPLYFVTPYRKALIRKNVRHIIITTT